MRESEILKFICANQGAVNTDELLYNLGDSKDVSEIIVKDDKFALCHPYGQPKVVARTRMKLCRNRECQDQGTCKGLHLCKNFLFSGNCKFSLTRRGCSFSHDMHSDPNLRILIEHELESLDRTELCILLLQNDNTLLPSICHDYNNGRCQEADSCKRLHICEKYVDNDCNCPKTHDFTAPQPLKMLQDKGVPDHLFRSLKAIYANKKALWFSAKRSDRGNRQPQRRSSNDGVIDGECDGNFPMVARGRGGNRGNRGSRGHRGNRGNRGNGGNRGNLQERQRTPSTGDLLSSLHDLTFFSSGCHSVDGNDEQQQDSSTSDISGAANDSDASSDHGSNRRRRNRNHTSRGRGGQGNRGNRGNHHQMQHARSTSDLLAAVDTANDGSNKGQRERPVRDKTDICMYFIKGFCKHDDKCFKHHDKMPYRWQVKEGDQWTALPDNETIEKDYCEPENSYSSTCPPVYFDTMTQGSNQVRRLSTINSLKEPTFIHTTEWVWYWEDELGKWRLYASAIGGHNPANMDSAKLEEKYLENDKDVVEFTAGSQSYSLSFQDMIQTNKRYGTKRVVRRRPRFVSAAEVRTAKKRRPLVQPSFTAIPDHWDKTQIPDTGYKSVSLPCSSDEYKEIEGLFRATMRGFVIVKIERIQNKDLWEVYQWQKNQMKKKSGNDVTEKKLFHGTDSQYVNAICQTNFDWRICGTHGTAYGKGSYFARDAKYSHSYTSGDAQKSMFVSRVLVGDYTKGSSSLVRPPSKDGGDVNFYDSCVDDVMSPSIFVVFEKHQIYPEYLLQYKNPHPLDSYGITPTPAPAPKPQPVPAPRVQPTTSSYKATTSTYQTSTSSYKPSTSSYQSTTSSYQPSTSSYKPTTSSYQPTTSSYQSSTSAYKPSTATYQTPTSSYPRTRFSPPSTPSPPPKKQDSCVIA